MFEIFDNRSCEMQIYVWNSTGQSVYCQFSDNKNFSLSDQIDNKMQVMFHHGLYEMRWTNSLPVPVGSVGVGVVYMIHFIKPGIYDPYQPKSVAISSCMY